MEKTSFISGRALKTLLLFIVLVGAGIGAYFFFKPKADLNAPYKIFYEYSANEKIEKINNVYTQTVISKMNDCKTKISENVTKNEITTNIEKDNLVKTLVSYSFSYDDTILETFAFIDNTDGKLANKQKELEKSYDDLVTKTNTCYDYYNTYIVNIDSLNYSAERIWQLAKGFNNTYYEFAKSLTNFYTKVSKIYDKYVKPQFSANTYSKKNFSVLTLWVNGLTNKVVANDTGDFAVENSSLLNLQTFKTTNYALEQTYLSNKVELDKVLSNFEKVDLQTCITYLIDTNYETQISKIEDADIQKAYKVLGQQYFLTLPV